MSSKVNERLQLLLTKYYFKDSSKDDENELFTLLDNTEDTRDWELILQELAAAEEPLSSYNSKQWEAVIYSIVNPKVRKQYHRIHFLRTVWFRYAAAILLLLSVVAYVFFTKQQPTEKSIIIAEQNKEPGTDKAVLTLSDGRQVVLENANNQRISDGNVSIGNTNGILSYNAVPTSETNSTGINTMTTPRGGQYQLVLPDDSRVWLNSASSLKYPVVFNGKQRIVELSGEAYFEVKGNKKMPFIVKTERGEVLVLGTEFNINSYADEPSFSATLVSGSVKISAGKDIATILPGQQATILNSNPDILTIDKDVDINRVIAWQKGIFEFKGANLDVIARQLSRWYDVEVKTIMTGSKDIKLSGGITKKTPLRTLLRMLEANGIDSKYEKNVVTLY